LRRDDWCEVCNIISILAILSHVPASGGFGRRINFGSIDARLHSADIFHCSANDCHNLRSFLLASRAEMI
jgi:hypothetical protein